MQNVRLIGFLLVIILCSCSKNPPSQGDDKSGSFSTNVGSSSAQSVPKLIRKENTLCEFRGIQNTKFHFSDDLLKATSWNKHGVMLWDVTTQRILKSFDFTVNTAKLNHDGSQILLNFYHDAKNNSPVLIDSHSGKIIKTYERMIYAEFTNMEPPIKIYDRHVAEKIMSQDGKLYFMGYFKSSDGNLVSEDRTKNLHVKFNGEIKSVAFSKDNTLAAIAADKKIQFYHYDDQYTEAHQIPYEGYLTSMAFSQDKKLLQLSYSNSKTHNRLEVRAVDSGEILFLKDSTLFLNPNNLPLLTADGQFIFVPEYLPEIVSTPESYRMVKIHLETQKRVFETDTFLENRSVYLTSDDENLIVGNTVFDANTGQKKVELKYHLNEIRYFDINNTGNLWAFNYLYQTFIFDKEQQLFTPPKNGYWQPSKSGFKEFGYYTASNFGMKEGSILGSEIGALIEKKVDPQKLAEARKIIKQELQKMKEVAEKQGGYGTANALEFFGPESPLFKVISNELFQKAQQGKILTAAYSPNRKYIAAISDTYSVYLLNARTKKIILILPYLSKYKDELMHDVSCQIFFSHNSQMVIYENIDAKKIVFSIPKKDTLFTIDAGNSHDAILHPEKEEILFSKRGNILQTINLKTGKKQFKTRLDTRIKHFNYAKNGDEIMVVTSKKEVYLYDAITGALVDSSALDKIGGNQFAYGKPDRKWASYNERETHVSIFQKDHHCYDFYPLSDGDWAAISPNGYFDGTEKGLEKLYFSDGQKTKSLAEFPDSLHLKGMMKMDATYLSRTQERDILEFF